MRGRKPERCGWEAAASRHVPRPRRARDRKRDRKRDRRGAGVRGRVGRGGERDRVRVLCGREQVGAVLGATGVGRARACSHGHRLGELSAGEVGSDQLGAAEVDLLAGGGVKRRCPQLGPGGGRLRAAGWRAERRERGAETQRRGAAGGRESARHGTRATLQHTFSMVILLKSMPLKSCRAGRRHLSCRVWRGWGGQASSSGAARGVVRRGGGACLVMSTQAPV